ncbi:MAG: hypothetical protein B7Y39_17525 [Bdellovibrio sp. 28-41-41]|nr:MAG: hypothetical protein B7Y39_17525 [Bdellovibrio sp. 28-41-41]
MPNVRWVDVPTRRRAKSLICDFENVGKGLALRQICEFLSSIGVPTKRRGQRWHPEMVRRILLRTKLGGENSAQ